MQHAHAIAMVVGGAGVGGRWKGGGEREIGEMGSYNGDGVGKRGASRRLRPQYPVGACSRVSFTHAAIGHPSQI